MRLVLILFYASCYYYFMEKNSREILSENNISITNPRLLVLEELLKNKKPRTVESLQKELGDKVATSTLYRVLNDLKSIGIVNEFLNPENITVVELFLQGDTHHHHLFCTLCGKVVDIELSISLEQYITSETKRLEKSSGFVIDDHGLELLGRCYECLDDV